MSLFFTFIIISIFFIYLSFTAFSFLLIFSFHFLSLLLYVHSSSPWHFSIRFSVPFSSLSIVISVVFKVSAFQVSLSFILSFIHYQHSLFTWFFLSFLLFLIALSFHYFLFIYKYICIDFLIFFPLIHFLSTFFLLFLSTSDLPIIPNTFPTLGFRTLRIYQGCFNGNSEHAFLSTGLPTAGLHWQGTRFRLKGPIRRFGSLN